MSTAPATRTARLSPITGLAVGAALAAVLVVAIATHPPPLTLAAALVAAAGIVALAAARYDLTIAAGFVLLGVVRVEPAPSDALLAAAAAVAVVAGRFDLRRMPGTILGLLVFLLALNLVSMTAAAELGDAVRFFAITLYMVVLAVWLTTYLNTRERMRRVVGAYVAGAAAFALLAVLALFVGYPGHDLLAGRTRRARRGCSRIPTSSGHS